MVGKTGLTHGTHASAEDRERCRDGRRESKEKAHFCNYANGARGLSGLGRPVGEERPAGASWAEGQVGRKVGWAESKEKEFPN
jgi:hypothetical protein